MGAHVLASGLWGQRLQLCVAEQYSLLGKTDDIHQSCPFVADMEQTGHHSSIKHCVCVQMCSCVHSQLKGRCWRRHTQAEMRHPDRGPCWSQLCSPGQTTEKLEARSETGWLGGQGKALRRCVWLSFGKGVTCA